MSDFPLDFKAVDVNGVPLAYQERGQGESVVFIHGSSQDMRTWAQQLRPFSMEYRTIIYSRRYARPNADIPPGEDDQMLPHVDDLLQLLRVLNTGPAHLVGSSWGGFIALLAALREPSSVRSMVLCEPPVVPLFLSNSPGPGELLRLLATRPVDGLRLVRFGLGALEPTSKAYRAGDIQRGGEIFGKAVLGEGGLENLPAETRQMVEENAAAEVAQFLGAGFPPLSREDVKSIRVPALVLGGQRSHPVLRKTLNGELARLLPRAERMEIPDASHLMHEQEPVAFNETVLSFLRRAS